MGTQKGNIGGARPGAGRKPSQKTKDRRDGLEQYRKNNNALESTIPIVSVRERLKEIRDTCAIDALVEIIQFSESDVARVQAVKQLKEWADTENPPEPKKLGGLGLVEVKPPNN